MDSFELLYIANKELKNKLGSDPECARFQKFSSSNSGVQNELIKRYTSKIEIEMDWVEAIEKGLVFIEKAIKEERQFIRSDGEVEPIEKIRKTSTASIRDLAKHSNYITHEAEPGGPTDVMPDKMLQAKKENDYAVYENRVVYAALIYLKDFVSSRLNKIREAATKFEADSVYIKKLDLGNQKLSFEFKMHSVKLNDRGIAEQSSIMDTLQRLDNSMSLIMAFLKTPLMVEVSKSDMVKRPITKTNVLRMNRNFRESLALFDFVADYQGDGFTIENKERIFNPFNKETNDDFANSFRTLYFLTYLHGSERESYYAEKYKEYLEQKKREEEEKILQKIRSIAAKAKMDGMTLEECLLAFQEANKLLEKRNEELYEKLEKTIEDHKREVEELNAKHLEHVQQLEAEFEKERNELIAKKEAEKEAALLALREEKDAYINDLNTKHAEEINSLNVSHAQEITSLKDAHADEVQALNDRYDANDKQWSEKYDANNKEWSDKYETNEKQWSDRYESNDSNWSEKYNNNDKQWSDRYEATKNDLNNQLASQKESYENDKKAYIEEKTTIIEGLNTDKDNLQKDLATAIEERDVSKAKNIVYESELGKSEPVDKYVGADTFKELEDEKKAFDAYFNKAWDNAKKAIRDRVRAEANEIEEKKKAKKAAKHKKKEEQTETIEQDK